VGLLYFSYLKKAQLQLFVTFYLLESVKVRNWVTVFVHARQQWEPYMKFFMSVSR